MDRNRLFGRRPAGVQRSAAATSSVSPALKPPLAAGIAAALLGAAAPCWPNAAGDADVPPTPAPVEVPQGPLATDGEPPSGWSRWFNPATAPFIPVPLISTDPNGGSTFGLIPT